VKKTQNKGYYAVQVHSGSLRDRQTDRQNYHR